MWGSYVGAFLFVLISFYVLVNRGDLPAILTEKQGFGGETTWLGKIVLIIAFPTAMLGLIIEGAVPAAVYYILILLFEFIYGFLVGWGAHYIFRAKNSLRGT